MSCVYNPTMNQTVQTSELYQFSKSVVSESMLLLHISHRRTNSETWANRMGYHSITPSHIFYSYYQLIHFYFTRYLWQKQVIISLRGLVYRSISPRATEEAANVVTAKHLQSSMRVVWWLYVYKVVRFMYDQRLLDGWMDEDNVQISNYSDVTDRV